MDGAPPGRPADDPRFATVRFRAGRCGLAAVRPAVPFITAFFFAAVFFIAALLTAAFFGAAFFAADRFRTAFFLGAAFFFGADFLAAAFFIGLRFIAPPVVRFAAFFFAARRGAALAAAFFIGLRFVAVLFFLAMGTDDLVRQDEERAKDHAIPATTTAIGATTPLRSIDGLIGRSDARGVASPCV